MASMNNLQLLDEGVGVRDSLICFIKRMENGGTPVAGGCKVCFGFSL